MSDAQTNLARHLETALAESGLSVDTVAERTKIPRTTILHLMKKPVSAILPERVYLRGHLRVLARELRTDPDDLVSLFDDAFPEPVDAVPTEPERDRFKSQSVAVSAALGGVALLSVVAAFMSALD